MKIKNLKGLKFGKLTVLDISHQNKHRNYMWRCLCECGNEKTIASGHLTGGHTKSCGCIIKKNGYTLNYKHGKRQTAEYKIWAAMKNRCYNPNVKDFGIYGKRGIKVCDRWKNSFENFLEDMGEKPSKIHSIDRINVNGNYEKNNCKWSTPKEQSSNRRNNIWIEFNGKRMILANWARELNTDSEVLLKRFKNTNSLDYIPNEKIILDNETGIFYFSIGEAAIAKNIKRTTLGGKLIGFRKNNTSLKYV